MNEYGENNIGDSERRGRIPNQKELEKELSEYLSKKYGGRIKIVSPLVLPKGDEASTDEGSDSGESEGLKAFDIMPEELESYLDSFVVKQEEAKSILSTKVCTHFHRVAHSRSEGVRERAGRVGSIKNNIIMIGPTGVGKTYIIKLIAHKLGVPFVKGDATKFSETGYVGGDVEDLVRDLVYEANEDIAMAENGIIYVDEIDKIASSGDIIGHDVSRTGVQRALLKPMEETDVELKVPHDPVSQIQAIENYRRTGKKEKKVVNTKNILFIMSGAFGGLAEIIKKRLQRQGIGFEADVRPTEIPWDILKHVTAKDLIEFGFESEFVGRLPVIVIFDELSEDDLVEILKNPNNPIILSKRQDFRAYGIDIKFEEEGLRKIAEMAKAEKTGARALVSAIEKVLIPFEKKLPSTKIRQFLVTRQVVESPKSELEKILSLAEGEGNELAERFEQARKEEFKQVKRYMKERVHQLGHKLGLDLYETRMDIIAKLYQENIYDINTALDEFAEMYEEIKQEEVSIVDRLNIKIEFDNGAVDEIINQAIDSGQEAGALCRQLANRLEYGLNLVKDRSGIDNFTINADAVTDMEQYINQLLKKYYSKESSNELPSGETILRSSR